MILVYIIWKYIVLNLCLLYYSGYCFYTKQSVSHNCNFQWGELFSKPLSVLWLHEKSWTFLLWILQEMIGYQRDTTELIQRRKMLRKAILCKQSFHPIGHVRISWSISLPRDEELTQLCQFHQQIFLEAWGSYDTWPTPLLDREEEFYFGTRGVHVGLGKKTVDSLRTPPTIEAGLALSLLYMSKALLSPVLDCVLFYLATPIPRCNG